MTTTSDQLGVHLDNYGVNVALIPGDGGDDYLVATRLGRTAEVWFKGGKFSRAFITGAGGQTFTELPPLLKELGVDAIEGVDVTPECPDSYGPGGVHRDERGRIVGDPVVVDDVWGHCDLPERGNTFRITRVTNTHAYGVVLTDSQEVQRCLTLNRRAVAEGRPGGLPYPYTRTQVDAMCRIRLDRMRPTADGYYRLPDSRR